MNTTSDNRVKVGIRVRPELPASTMKGFNIIENDASIDMVVSSQQHAFKFESVLGPTATQEAVFTSCAQGICDKVLEGFNGCVFAYGQTGAGKTHTMTGPQDSTSYVDRGICMRTASYFFSQLARLHSSTQDSLSVRLSVLEIYNEVLTDLLREAPTSQHTPDPIRAPKLTIVDTPQGVAVPSLYVLPLSSEEDAFSLLMEACSNRVIAEHQLNRSSSRSHVVYTFYITRTKVSSSHTHTSKHALADPEVIQSKLHLVDLAGAERSEKTQSTGQVQKEAKYINKSLSFLEQVVLALTQPNRAHVPYRQSKLTYMLKDSLGGSCHTVMIACVWPHVNHLWETFSTLKFAGRIRCIENTPQRNSLYTKDVSSHRLLAQVAALKRELAMRDAICGRETWSIPLTPTQRLHTLRQASALLALPVHDEGSLYHVPASELTVHSIAHAQCLIELLRATVWETCDRDAGMVFTAIERMTEGFKVAENIRMYGQSTAQVPPIPVPPIPVLSIPVPSIPAPDTDPAMTPDKATAPFPTDTSHTKEGSPSEDDTSSLPNPNSSRGTNGTTLTFAEFSAGAGYQLYRAYEDVKIAVKEEKARQKLIVSMVNQQKGKIDTLLIMLRECENVGVEGVGVEGAEGDNEAERVSLQAQIDDAKLAYRAGYMELQLCKTQINEAVALKKRAMAGLVAAFDRLATQQRVPLP